jgi:SsrA-binding protein
VAQKQKKSQFKFTQKNDVAVVNRRARHDYEISDTYDCGIVLTGTEVKSIRMGGAQIAEAYASLEDGRNGLPEMWIYGMYIPHYLCGTYNNVEPRRKRKLLLHRAQLNKLVGASSQKGYTLVPLKLHFSNGRAKLEIGLAKGRKSHDKRQAIGEREMKRDMERERSAKY